MWRIVVMAAGLLVMAPPTQAELANAEPVAAVGPQRIRVAVAQQRPQIQLSVQGPFRIVERSSSAPLVEGRRLDEATVKGSRHGIVLGEQMLSAEGVRVEPVRDAAIKVNGQRLRGLVEITQRGDRTLLVVNHINLEDYLRGVLSKEAPHYWPAEALRALAIASRTYALFQRLSKSAVEYDVTADVLSQVYGGRSAERNATSQAVEDTEGLVLVHDGVIFPAFFHSTCGGLTEPGTVMGPYRVAPLRGGVSCPFCLESPVYRWERRLTKGDLVWAVKQKGRGSVWPLQEFRVASTTPSGRVDSVLIRGGSRTLTLSGYEFRDLLGFERIRSTAFTITPDRDEYRLEGRGWGHGVGLCQWGTAEMARRGFTAPEILAFYYPGASLIRLGEAPVQPLVIDSKGDAS